jgi:hypothetical protein
MRMHPAGCTWERLYEECRNTLPEKPDATDQSGAAKGIRVQRESARMYIFRKLRLMKKKLRAPVEVRQSDGKGYYYYYYADRKWTLPEDLFLETRDCSEDAPIAAGAPSKEKDEEEFEKLVHARQEWQDIIGHEALQTKPEIWQALLHSVHQHLRLNIKPMKSSENENPKYFCIEPYRLANLGGDWFVLGIKKSKKSDTLYSVPISSIGDFIAGDKFTIDSATATEIADLINNAFGCFLQFKRDGEAKIWFDRTIEPEVLNKHWRKKPKTVTWNKEPGIGIVLSFPISKYTVQHPEQSGTGQVPYEHIMRWVLSWGRYAKVLGPPDLKQAVETEIAAMRQGGQ